jgi:hypothetical protein
MRIGVLVLLFSVNFFGFGQPKPRSGEQNQVLNTIQIGPVTVPDDPVPITGIEFLLGSGLMAGLYSHFRRRNKNTEN